MTTNRELLRSTVARWKNAATSSLEAANQAQLEGRDANWLRGKAETYEECAEELEAVCREMEVSLSRAERAVRQHYEETT